MGDNVNSMIKQQFSNYDERVAITYQKQSRQQQKTML